MKMKIDHLKEELERHSHQKIENVRLRNSLDKVREA